jgi:hypothetical protein
MNVTCECLSQVCYSDLKTTRLMKLDLKRRKSIWGCGQYSHCLVYGQVADSLEYSNEPSSSHERRGISGLVNCNYLLKNDHPSYSGYSECDISSSYLYKAKTLSSLCLSLHKNILTEIYNSTAESIHNKDLMNNPDIMLPDSADTWWEISERRVPFSFQRLPNALLILLES